MFKKDIRGIATLSALLAFLDRSAPAPAFASFNFENYLSI
jgi:hypothetical protein